MAMKQGADVLVVAGGSPTPDGPAKDGAGLSCTPSRPSKTLCFYRLPVMRSTFLPDSSEGSLQYKLDANSWRNAIIIRWSQAQRRL